LKEILQHFAPKRLPDEDSSPNGRCFCKSFMNFFNLSLQNLLNEDLQ